MKQTLEEAAIEELIHSYSNKYNGNGAFEYGQEAMINMFRKGAEWQAEQSPWISVEMAIPKDNSSGVVQVRDIDGKEWEMAAHRVVYNIYPYIKTGYITHWRVFNE